MACFQRFFSVMERLVYPCWQDMVLCGVEVLKGLMLRLYRDECDPLRSC